MGLIRGLAKNSLLGLSRLMKMTTLKRLSGKPFYVVNYHSIRGVDADPYINRNVYRTISEFEDDVRFYSKHFNVLSAAELIDLIANNKSFPEDSIVITFDDGLRINYEYQVPILKKYNLTATFFLCSAFVDNKELHFGRKANLLQQWISEGMDSGIQQNVRDYLLDNSLHKGDIEQSLNSIGYHDRRHLDAIARLIGIDFKEYLIIKRPYLGTTEVRDMLTDGFSIGAHSVDHPRYSLLSLEEQVRQTVESMDQIERGFNLNYRLFAFPYDDEVLPEEFFERIRLNVDLTFGMGGFSDPQGFRIQRGEVESTRLPVEQALKYRFLLSFLDSWR